MGVSYSAVLAVGREFDEKYDVEQFVREYLTLSDEDEAYIDDEGISEFLYSKKDWPTCECLDLYHGDPYYIGFKLNPRDTERFAENVADAIEKWNKMFPNHPAEIIHTVRIS
jgi:hypothetical protein